MDIRQLDVNPEGSSEGTKRPRQSLLSTGSAVN